MKPYKANKITRIILLALCVFTSSSLFAQNAKIDDEKFVTYIAEPYKQNIHFYWKDDKQANFGSIQNLKNWLTSKHKKLIFAMNGGMYKQDHSPQGLFVDNKKIITPLDTSTGNGNFYLKPNGVFYITTKNVPLIITTNMFKDNGNIKFATQSGPMLLINDSINTAFKEGSTNLNIRNGVGILPGNKVVFVMSKKEINFYDFANYFKSLGCKNALYLDGFVLRIYLPEKNWVQTDGDFGVIIGITENLN